MSSKLIPKRALLPPNKSQTTSSYTETKAQRANNLAFESQGSQSKATKAANKREYCRADICDCSVPFVPDICHAFKAKEFDSSVVVSPLLDPRILERRVMAAKAGDRAAR